MATDSLTEVPKRDAEGFFDLSKHNNYMSQVLTKPMYLSLKDKVTKQGVSLDDNLMTGLMNPGHPFIMTVGATAGDEESYVTHKAFFDAVISARHNGFKVGVDKHPTELAPNSIKNGKLDEKYVLSSRVRAGRCIRGYRLPPKIEQAERDELEAIIKNVVVKLDGEHKGIYTGLYDMTDEEHERYITEHIMFEKPVSPLLIHSGMASHWPHGRGMFKTDKKDFIIWVNEEDHMRIISMQKGGDMGAVFKRWCDGINKMDALFKTAGKVYQHSKDLGYIHTCPSNLGTGIRCGVHIKVPLLSAQPFWKEFLAKYKLQARGTGGVDTAATGGTFDISNADRLGNSETQLVQFVIDGVNKMVELEKLLEAGKSVQGKW